MMRKSLSAKAVLMLAAICPLLFTGTPTVNASISQSSQTVASFIPGEYLPSPGEIVLTKTAAPVNDDAGNREFEVELTMRGMPLEANAPADIVLVIDLSQSMALPIDGSTGSRLLAIKNAANDFITSVLPIGTTNRLALVTYSGSPDDGPDNDAWANYSFDDWSGRSTFINKMNLLTAVTTLAADEGTNMEAGFAKAENVLSQSASSNKIVIFMTDGEPTFYYDENGETAGDGISFDSTAASQALDAAERLSRNHDVTIFTVGLVADDVLAENVAAVLNPTGSGYNEAYYQASDSEGLSSIYAQLAQTIDLIAHDTVLTDQIQVGFEYVEGSLRITGQPGNASYAEYKQIVFGGDAASAESLSAGEIHWSPGAVSNETLKLSYRIAAEDRLYGAVPTNQKAWLEFIPAAGNLFYSNSSFDSPDKPGSKQIVFERPVVCVGPLACDDDFYQTEAGTTLVAGGNSALPCLLDNDHAKFYLSSAEGWQTTAVQTELPEDSVTKLGKITSFSSDGSFTYISDVNAAGSETFSYNLKTTVRNSSGDIQELFSRAVVTIEVIPAAATDGDPATTAEPEDTTKPAETTDPDGSANSSDSEDQFEKTTDDQIEQSEIILDESQTGKTGENASSASEVLLVFMLFAAFIMLIMRKTLKGKP